MYWSACLRETTNPIIYDLASFSLPGFADEYPINHVFVNFEQTNLKMAMDVPAAINLIRDACDPAVPSREFKLKDETNFCVVEN